MSERTLELVEYETLRAQLTDHEARRLVTSCRGALVVIPDSLPGWWQITATSLVGTLHIDRMKVLIRPKIRPDNLFLMLGAGLPAGAWGGSTFDYSTTHDLLRAVIAFFVRTAESSLARGPLHAYRATKESLVAMRGRLDVPAMMGRAGVLCPIDCQFDDFTADVPENRFLKSAFRRALRVPQLDPHDRHRLNRLLVALAEVEDQPVAANLMEDIARTRLNAHYLPTLTLAQVVLDNLSLVDQVGNTSAATFIIDMNDLFQRFMTERLRRALQGRLNVLAEPRHHLDLTRKIGLAPDLEFVRGGRCVAVGDLKYKISADGKGRNPDYYQLLAYTTALELSEGALIYCGTDQADRPSTKVVRHANKRLHTWAIDLTASAASVDTEIATLADWIVGSASL